MSGAPGNWRSVAGSSLSVVIGSAWADGSRVASPTISPIVVGSCCPCLSRDGRSRSSVENSRARPGSSRLSARRWTPAVVTCRGALGSLSLKNADDGKHTDDDKHAHASDAGDHPGVEELGRIGFRLCHKAKLGRRRAKQRVRRLQRL